MLNVLRLDKRFKPDLNSRVLILLIRKILIIAHPALKLIRRLISAVEVVIQPRERTLTDVEIEALAQLSTGTLMDTSRIAQSSP